MILDEIIENNEEFKEVKNVEGFSAYSRIGSIFNKDLVVMKAIMKLDKKYEMKDIVKTLLKADERMKWDSIQTETQILKEYDKNVLLKRYVVIVPFPFMKNREFIEKQFVFQSDNKIYIHCSSVDDHMEALKQHLTRAKSFICTNRISKVGDSVIMEVVSQLDSKIFIPSVLLVGKMADTMKQFKDDLIKKLDSLHFE